MFKPVIKWSGSKRSQANIIKSYIDFSFNTYIEPFIGGGSVLYQISPPNGICGDICKPLIDLWNEIKKNPLSLSNEYKIRWEMLQKQGYEVYYKIRDRFNKENNPMDLLFLSRTCVNGLIRFNSKGEFNNSLHHTRPGINPEKLKDIILEWSERIKGCTFDCYDYRETLENAKKGDLVYLDPPYFHTKGRYYGKIEFDEFVNQLYELNKKNVKFILSFDGIRGDNNYLVDIPKELFKRHKLLPSGNSSFKKVMGKESVSVFESLYLNW